MLGKQAMEKELGILYADISGSTRLYRTLGTEEAKHQLERCVKRMERSIESFKGNLIAPSFDEMVATFPSADDVLQAALDMQRRIADLPPVSGVRLTIRIGIHFGSVIDGPDGVSGSAAEIGKSLLNLAGAGQIISCDFTSRALSKTYLENLFPITGMSLSTPFGDSQLLEVKERPDRTVFRPTTTTAASTTAHQQDRLFVRIEGKAYVVDNAAPRMSFGRDKDCIHTLHGSKASRHHAVIEKRGRNGFVLIDQSTNGTYLKIEGAGELKLQQGEAIIAGSGKIGFGHSTEIDGDVVEIELV
jgi:adenylate cyclase